MRCGKVGVTLHPDYKLLNFKTMSKEQKKTLKATLKVAVDNLKQTKAALEATKREARKERERLLKMVEATDNRFLEALDIISSLEEENSKLKRLAR